MDKDLLAYVVGIAIGDGNLSNPNGRATRLRVTCDKKYPQLIKKIQNAIQILFPNNRVSISYRKENYLDVSCYSNQWERILGWRVGFGSKIAQNISVPSWAKEKPEYIINCLRGLIETDGSIYSDRGYKTVMFASAIQDLAENVYDMIKFLGFSPRIYKIKRRSSPYNYNQSIIYHVRVFRGAKKFLDIINPEKF